MAVEVNVSRQLDNNYVQVDVKSKKVPAMYFKVPRQNADAFCKTYKKNNKKMFFLTDAAFITSVLGGCGLSYLCTKNLKSGLRLGIGAVSAIIAGSLATLGMEKYMQKNSEQFLNSFGAEQIFYENNKPWE